jgi:outer membrane lipoprotein SlyB
MMFKHTLVVILSLAGGMASAQAYSSNDQYKAEVKQINQRYADDRAMCADEKNQGQRMKCLRDAKSENSKALAAAKASLNGGSNSNKMACLDCGKVLGVRTAEQDGKGGALGVIGGGVAGGLLGNQVGGGTGKKLATVAGAIGGAYAGKKIEEKARATKVWLVDVQYDNGSKHAFQFDHDPGFHAGDRVRNSGQSISRY